MVLDRRRGPADDVVSVRLTRKYADVIDGVDLSHVDVGDDVRLSSREAALLVAEGWAVQSADRVDAEPPRPLTGHERRTADRSVDADPVRQLGPATMSPGHPLAPMNTPPPRFIQHPSEPSKV
jgi:hypothetical protein